MRPRNAATDPPLQKLSGAVGLHAGSFAQGSAAAERSRHWVGTRHLRPRPRRRHCAPPDRQAKFVWLKRIQDKPKRAIGFDFDGAEFSHVDSKVTFEVLLTSFGLEGDVGLARLGTLGGIPVAEAAGLAAIVSGARSLQPDDGALLLSVTPSLDSLYHTYRTEQG
jgi:hypothetical protein